MKRMPAEWNGAIAGGGARRRNGMAVVGEGFEPDGGVYAHVVERLHVEGRGKEVHAIDVGIHFRALELHGALEGDVWG